MFNPLNLTMVPKFLSFSQPPENYFIKIMNDTVMKRETIPMKHMPKTELPDAQQILQFAYEPGVLLSSVSFLNGCFTTLLCFKPSGFKSGTTLKLPDEWWRYAKESNHSPNIICSTVVRDIMCGAELIVGKKTKPSTKFISKTHTLDTVDHESGGEKHVYAQDPKNWSTLMNTNEEGEGFSCDRCGKMFSYEYYRDKHLKYTRCVDNGNRKYPCTICNRSFEKRDRLRIHILHVHENHRPHICSVCSKSFSQSSSLNKHLRVHSGERPYRCEFCPKAFTASSILRTHIRQHSGEKPFKCAHCGKAFASHAAHDSHVRRSHTIRPICDSQTTSKSTYNTSSEI